MDTNVDCLSCSEVAGLGCFQLSDVRYDDRNAVNERVSKIVLQLHLIWTPAQILQKLSSRGRSKTSSSPKTEFFVTLVDDLKL